MGPRCIGASAALSVALMVAASPAGATVLYAYDDLGRITSITYDDGKRVAYTYDAAGNRTQHVVDQVANLPPTAVDDAIAIDLNASPLGIVYPLTNDSDPNMDILSVQSVTAPSLGTATIGGGGSYITYTYTASYALAPTVDSFNYTVSDGRGGTAVAAVNVTIDNNSTPPCNPLIEICEIQ